jgi:hydroxymethylpyrimidine/phosphomethylpyrimidine kinase
MPNNAQGSGTSNFEPRTSNGKPVLLISASDSSCAAGMQVDVRVVNDLVGAPRCALTAVTVQGEAGLVAVFPVEPQIVIESVNSAVFSPPGIGAVKIGLITAQEVALAIATTLNTLHESGIPVILDPVMRSTPGSVLASREVKEILVRHLLPVTTVVTPNRDELDELALIAGAGDGSEEEKAGALLSLGTGAVLVTGGDDGGRVCVDILYRAGENAHVFEHPKIGEGSTRGTGCSLSTAIAVNMGKGMEPIEAVDASIRYVTKKIEKAGMVGNQRLLFPGNLTFEV